MSAGEGVYEHVVESLANTALQAAEARWRDSIHDHGSDTTAPRIAAWRALEALRGTTGEEAS